MRRKPVISVDWNGRETVAMLSQAIAHTGQIQLRLPAEYNHALFDGVARALDRIECRARQLYRWLADHGGYP